MQSLSTHLRYWILPSLVLLLGMAIYFFNWFDARDLIAPEINREFGLLENLQLLLILCISGLAGYTATQKTHAFERFIYWAICGLAFFVFLEEIDYGLHYYEYFIAGDAYIEVQPSEGIRNIHNNGSLTHLIKLVVYCFFIAFFLGLPLLKTRLRPNSLFHFLAPSPYMIWPLISMAIINQLALFGASQLPETSHALTSNISEFEEVMIYYIALLYLNELRRHPFYPTQIFQLK